jgi:hypothetical protein
MKRQSHPQKADEAFGALAVGAKAGFTTALSKAV